MGESDKKEKESVVIKEGDEKKETQSIILVNEEMIQNKTYIIRGKK